MEKSQSATELEVITAQPLSGVGTKTLHTAITPPDIASNTLDVNDGYSQLNPTLVDPDELDEKKEKVRETGCFCAACEDFVEFIEDCVECIFCCGGCESGPPGPDTNNADGSCCVDCCGGCESGAPGPDTNDADCSWCLDCCGGDGDCCGD